jgi:hypothetical protein
MAKDSKTLVDNKLADEGCDAGLLRVLKTPPNSRNKMKTGRRKTSAAKGFDKMALPSAGRSKPDTK